MIKAVYVSVLALPLAMGVQITNAEPVGVYLYESVTTDPSLAKEFQRIMAPVISDAPWVKTYGTMLPRTVEIIDDTTYQVYAGCKPHNCPAENYVVMYDPNTSQVSAAAFVSNQYDGSVLTDSRITWLGAPQYDLARSMVKYLY